jgi:hypothetical protein
MIMIFGSSNPLLRAYRDARVLPKQGSFAIDDDVQRSCAWCSTPAAGALEILDRYPCGYLRREKGAGHEVAPMGV